MSFARVEWMRTTFCRTEKDDDEAYHTVRCPFDCLLFARQARIIKLPVANYGGVY